MSGNLSVAQILADLETQIAHFEAQGPFHARQEAFHRAEKERCENEVATLRERYEAFKKASAEAREVVQRKGTGGPPPLDEEDDGRSASMPTLISWVVAAKADGDSFGATALTQEINQHYSNRLRQPINLRSVSVALSRMAKRGQVKVVREGKAHHEALYTQGSKAKR
jgi:hypothetical protein